MKIPEMPNRTYLKMRCLSCSFLKLFYYGGSRLRRRKRRKSEAGYSTIQVGANLANEVNCCLGHCFLLFQWDCLTLEDFGSTVGPKKVTKRARCLFCIQVTAKKFNPKFTSLGSNLSGFKLTSSLFSKQVLEFFCIENWQLFPVFY